MDPTWLDLTYLTLRLLVSFLLCPTDHKDFRKASGVLQQVDIINQEDIVAKWLSPILTCQNRQKQIPQ